MASAQQVIDMTKQEFIDRLSTKDNLSDSDKIEVCQHYINNYPVMIHGFTTRLDTVISGGSVNAINFAYNQLKQRVKEFEEWTQ